MGRELVTMDASASVSRHNSEQDALDARAWNDFVADVRGLAVDYQNRGLDIMVSGGDIYYHGRED